MSILCINYKPQWRLVYFTHNVIVIIFRYYYLIGVSKIPVGPENRPEPTSLGRVGSGLPSPRFGSGSKNKIPVRFGSVLGSIIFFTQNRPEGEPNTEPIYRPENILIRFSEWFDLYYFKLYWMLICIILKNI